jgi:hypothetical protein
VARGAGRRRVHWRRHGVLARGLSRRRVHGWVGVFRTRRPIVATTRLCSLRRSHDGRASTRVAEPFVVPQEAVPKRFVPGPEISN